MRPVLLSVIGRTASALWNPDEAWCVQPGVDEIERAAIRDEGYDPEVTAKMK